MRDKITTAIAFFLLILIIPVCILTGYKVTMDAEFYKRG